MVRSIFFGNFKKKKKEKKRKLKKIENKRLYCEENCLLRDSTTHPSWKFLSCHLL